MIEVIILRQSFERVLFFALNTNDFPTLSGSTVKCRIIPMAHLNKFAFCTPVQSHFHSTFSDSFFRSRFAGHIFHARAISFTFSLERVTAEQRRNFLFLVSVIVECFERIDVLRVDLSTATHLMEGFLTKPHKKNKKKKPLRVVINATQCYFQRLARLGSALLGSSTLLLIDPCCRGD